MTWWRLEGRLFGRFEEAEGQNKKITEVCNWKRIGLDEVLGPQTKA